MIKALVTGGAGYFGELLTRKLLERGDSVRIFDVNTPTDIGRGVEFMQGDIRDLDALLAACQGIDVVFHNAAQVAMAKNKDLFWSVNRDGTKNLLEAAARQGVKKIIYTSSSAVYGVPKSNPLTEEIAPIPVEEYGRAKLSGEALCCEYARNGLDVSIVRPCTIMGPGRLGIFQILFEWIFQGKNVPVFDGGKNIYQFVHGDDFAQLCIQAGTARGADVFNCGTDRFEIMRELLRTPLSSCRDRLEGEIPAYATHHGHESCFCAEHFTPGRLSRIDVRSVYLFRYRQGPCKARLDSPLLKQRNVRRELRLVSRQS